jgi:hypothetical protein
MVVTPMWRRTERVNLAAGSAVLRAPNGSKQQGVP